jgi:uncharacterized protein GlcG (DUF336 family)
MFDKPFLTSRGIRIVSTAALGIALAVVGGRAFSAQDKYTLRVPNGLAFSDFRGYENWQVVAVSQTEDLLKVMVANPTMIDAYRAGVPGNGKPAEAKKRDWKMNVAVVDSGGNLVAFQRMDGAMLASIQIAEHKARAAATFRRETKQFEDGIQLMHLNYLLAFDGIIASRGGIPLIDRGAITGAIGCSGGTDSQDEIVSKAGAAVINQPPARHE